MPIRFRCAYCNQLMGIARRKAGSVVRCPKCAGQVIVPNPIDQPPPAPAPGLAPAAPGPVLFESSDFDKVFDEPVTAGAAPQRKPAAFSFPAAAAPPPAVDVNIDVAPISGPIAGPGIFLTPAKLTLVSVLVVILLGFAFFLGLLVGRS